MPTYRPISVAANWAREGRIRKASLQALRPVIVIATLAAGIVWLSSGTAFVAGGQPSFHSRGQKFSPSTLALRAEPSKKETGKEIVDAEVLDEGDADEDDDFEGDDFEDEGDLEAIDKGQEGYPDEAYADYGPNEDPPDSWFERRRIHHHKVNMLFFDQYAKPKSFFPHELRPGDTIRVFYMSPSGQESQDEVYVFPLENMRETFFDGIIMGIKGAYHARTLALRTFQGKGNDKMGVEVNIPMHSPLVKKIDILRRGYIGKNKNCFFIRGMVGKKNAIPLDKDRAAMDELYASLRRDGREDEIPEPEYPQTETEAYPLPAWRQDDESWDESIYDAKNVDTRSDYELHVIGRFRRRPGPTY